MKDLKQFIIDSVQKDYTVKFETLSNEKQRQIAQKFTDIIQLFEGGAIRVSDAVEPLIAEAKAYVERGQHDRAIKRMLEAFSENPEPRFYVQLAHIFSALELTEDAIYYETLALKLTAYETISQLAKVAVDYNDVKEQMIQLLHYPESYDGWLKSVQQLNDEELKQYEHIHVDQPIIKEEKRTHRVVAKTAETTAHTSENKNASIRQEDEQHVYVRNEPQHIEDVEQLTSHDATAFTPPMSNNVMVPQMEQPSPYIDPATYVAMQQEVAENERATDEEEELNDLESMYFGELYDEEK